MSSDPERVAASLVTMGVALGAAVAAVQGIAHIANLAFDADAEILSADVDGNPFAWVSSMATLAGGFVALTLAWFDRVRARGHLLLAVILVFFSMDDVAAVHEKIGTAVRSGMGLPSGWGRVVWPMLFFPLLAAAARLLWERAREAPEPAARGIKLGLLCLVVAVGAELASAAWYTTGGTGESWPGALEVVVEEGLEVFAWTAIAAALAGAAYARLVVLEQSRRGA